MGLGNALAQNETRSVAATALTAASRYKQKLDMAHSTTAGLLDSPAGAAGL